MKLFFSTTGFYYQNGLEDNKYGGYYWLSFVTSSYVRYIGVVSFNINQSIQTVVFTVILEYLLEVFI